MSDRAVTFLLKPFSVGLAKGRGIRLRSKATRTHDAAKALSSGPFSWQAGLRGGEVRFIAGQVGVTAGVAAGGVEGGDVAGSLREAR